MSEIITDNNTKRVIAKKRKDATKAILLLFKRVETLENQIQHLINKEER
jgi:hypothetical protein